MKFLIADDDPDYRKLVLQKLHNEFPYSEIIEITNRNDFDNAIAKWNFDVVITDLNNTWLNGFTVCRLIRERDPYMPVIMLTASGDEEVVAEAMKLGLSDYVTKKHLTRLPVAIRESLEKARIQKERDHSNHLLKVSEERFHNFMDNSPTASFIKDADGRYVYGNKAFMSFFNAAEDSLLGKTDFDLWPTETAKRLHKHDMDIFSENNTSSLHETVLTPNGAARHWLVFRFPLKDTSGRQSLGGIAIDITERKKAEEEREKLREQLFHAQKLDAIGKLAGGVAHEFNNILAVIIGFGSLLQTEMKQDDTSNDYIQRILSSAERAKNLTQGLLAFSRKQLSNPKPVSLNDIVKQALRLLSMIIPENIKIGTLLINRDCIIMADAGQIEQVLMNLVTNAKDAMPGGGSLSVSTDIMEMDPAFIKEHGYGETGKYALIAVSDTGTGMDAKTKEMIFEPFFTTKEVGKGTGIGLAIVYGIVKQHNGYINVYSEVGKGTTFRIYLPLIESEAETTPAEIEPMPKGGTETILIAEDNADVRNLIKLVLEKNGYEVIEARDGDEAVDKFNKHKGTTHLLLLDVIMPNKNGKEAYDAIRESNPAIKAIFMSGYNEDILNKDNLPKEGVSFISKPVSPIKLLKIIREVLDK